MCWCECLTWVLYFYTQTVIHPAELSKQPDSASCTFANESAPEQSEPEAVKLKSRWLNLLHYETLHVNNENFIIYSD